MANFNIEPPTGLLEKIMGRIQKKERVFIFERIVLFSILFFASLAGFIPSLKMLSSDLSSSGFFSFFSLIFSDFSTVTTYWQSFSMILFESLPALSLAVFLAVLLTLLASIKYLSKDVKTIMKSLA